MTTRSRFLAALFALAFVIGAQAEEGKEKSAPVGPPQPRIVAPLPQEPLPPRATNPSWLLYQEGIRLFGQKRLGESLVAFQKAIDTRTELFSRCAFDIDAATTSKEAKRAGDSISELVRLLAARDLIPQEYEAINTKSAGSLVAELGLLRATSPSAPLRGLIDATLLVVEEAGISRVGDSLGALKRAVSELARYPEAEAWIGRVYLAEGELRLAELQYRRAYDLGSAPDNSPERLAMLDALAGIYKAEGDLKGYESSLKSIADSSELFAKKDIYFRNSMERVLGEKGIDKLMALYRLDESVAVGAYSGLGELYLQAGRRIATIYLAAAVDTILTRSISAIKVDEPGYAFTGLQELASRILADREMAPYAAYSALWKDLFLLGSSLASSGYRDSAREIWITLEKVGAPEPWGDKASAALAAPVTASRRLSP